MHRYGVAGYLAFFLIFNKIGFDSLLADTYDNQANQKVLEKLDMDNEVRQSQARHGAHGSKSVPFNDDVKGTHTTGADSESNSPSSPSSPIFPFQSAAAMGSPASMTEEIAALRRKEKGSLVWNVQPVTTKSIHFMCRF